TGSRLHDFPLDPARAELTGSISNCVGSGVEGSIGPGTCAPGPPEPRARRMRLVSPEGTANRRDPRRGERSSTPKCRDVPLAIWRWRDLELLSVPAPGGGTFRRSQTREEIQ